MTFYPQKNGTFSSDIKFFLFTGWTNAMFLRWLRFGWLSRKVLQSFFFFFLNYLVNDLQERTYLWFKMRKNDEMATKFKWRVIFNKVFHLISNPRRNNRRLKLQRAIATQLIHFFFLVSDNWFVCMIPNEVASSMQSFLSNLSLLPNYLPNIFNFPSDFLFLNSCFHTQNTIIHYVD